jgi:D-alanyl-D-alanine carboxypeptidase
VVVRTPAGVRRAAAGAARLAPRRALQPTDRYRIASVTKSFVAAVVLQLVGEGRLRLSDPVARRLPGLVPDGGTITIRQLLSHSSGLFDYDEDSAWVKARLARPGRVWSARELVRIAVRHPPHFEPGSFWRYSNTNYVVLGLLVEAVTGRPLGAVLRSRLVEPLQLRATAYPLRTALTGAYAHGYLVSGPPLPGPPGSLIDTSALVSPSSWGAGQLVSNADDVTAFFAALLGGRLLRPAQLRALKTPVAGFDYGLGIYSRPTRCGVAWGHNGDIPGWRNVVFATSDGRRVATVMVNVDGRLAWRRIDAAAETAFCSG